MIYGYARVSTAGQSRDGNSLEDQAQKLRSAGCEEIYHDAYTGTKMDRPEFTVLMAKLANGDRLVVTKLDRFARTTAGGIETIRELLGRGVSIHILNMGLIDNTPTGRLMVTMLLGFAEFERDMIVERTMAGKEMAKASKPGWREGRKEIEMDDDAFQKFREKQKRREMTVEECCEALNISRSTWYNRVKTA
jgi:DNA invertase Pin-like site-specific DNA recombinase